MKLFSPLILLAVGFATTAFAADATVATNKPAVKNTATPVASGAGYLANAKAGPLRFAPAVPPRPADLPPVPVTHDPQPTRPPEFPKVAEGPQTIVTTRRDETPTAVFPPSESTAPKARSAADFGATLFLTPQMLVRFFPNGKPIGAALGTEQTIVFQVPVRPAPESSSATYTVK